MSAVGNVEALRRPAWAGHVTQARVLLSEWTKLRSVRSTRWSLLVATVLTIGFPILAAAVISSHWGHQSAAERASFNPLDPALIGKLDGFELVPPRQALAPLAEKGALIVLFHGDAERAARELGVRPSARLLHYPP